MLTLQKISSDQGLHRLHFFKDLLTKKKYYIQKILYMLPIKAQESTALYPATENFYKTFYICIHEPPSVIFFQNIGNSKRYTSKKQIILRVNHSSKSITEDPKNYIFDKTRAEN